MKTDDLIQALAQDRMPTRRLGKALAAALAGGAVITAVLFFATIGMRPDVDSAMHTGRFLFKFLVTLTLATTATGLILRMAQPGVPLGRDDQGLRRDVERDLNVLCRGRRRDGLYGGADSIAGVRRGEVERELATDDA